MTDPQPGPQIRLGHIMLERAEFSHRDDYLSIPAGTSAGGEDVQIETQVMLADDRSKVRTRVRVHTHAQKDPLYRFDVVMVLLAEVESAPVSEAVDKYITGSTVGFLFPFLRETIGNLTARGRFGPVWLQPINVRAITDQVHLQEGARTKSAEVAAPKSNRRTARRRV